MKLGSIKSWADVKAVIDRPADIRRMDERGAVDTCTVVGKEDIPSFTIVSEVIPVSTTDSEYTWVTRIF